MEEREIYRAKILSEAVPYLQEYNGKTVVVKYGGNAMINEELMNNVISDICLMTLVGINVVLVHGGGPEINKALKRSGIESKFIDGLRYTDEETIDIVQEVLAGKVNKNLVKLIMNGGGSAVGLCGIDNKLLEAKKIKDELGYVGTVTQVNNEIIKDAIKSGYIPVIASIAMDDEGNSYNVNADYAAAAIADSLEAENLIVVSDIPGLLRDPHDEKTLIPEVSIQDVENLKEEGIIAGGMIPKVDCITHALKGNMSKAVIIDGRIPHSILIEILSKDGSGTLFTR